MNKIIIKTVIIICSFFYAENSNALLSAGPDSVEDGRKVLSSVFTSGIITTDGIVEEEWERAGPSDIGIAMKADLSEPAERCSTYGRVRSMWNGAYLYILVEVTDADITAEGRWPGDQDGVEIFFDLFNDKFPKFEEDDAIMRINCKGILSGNGNYAERLRHYAVSGVYDDSGAQKGYLVEAAIATGGITVKNGSSSGIEICINDAESSSGRCRYKIFWNSGKNRGIDDNSMWGDVVLTAHDENIPLAPDTYMLEMNIKKAEALTRGIWTDEKNLERALKRAVKKSGSGRQKRIDAVNGALEEAIKSLRRKGKYPDPYDLPSVTHLPDPFTFMDGRKVKSHDDWELRREEIKDLVQYYEYGYMPSPPEQVMSVADGSLLRITVTDKGRSASFNTMLSVPVAEQCGRSGPYPVIVSIDFRAAPGNAVYLDKGYAVLSISYSDVASDNYEHKGAFYSLYPYDVSTGNDTGTLLAWAWGASRAVDGLMHLAGSDPSFANIFDFDRIAVTGFSRCGKAALVAGLLDERFGVVNPGASGCGGAAVYRYDSFGNTPYRQAPFGNVYAWGKSTGCEVLGDRIRHQGHNANEMLGRFLNHGRVYKTNTTGYGERMPYDHHEILAAIAPRAVIITTADDDYANGAEGDCISIEGARPVYQFLGADQNIVLNIRTTDPSGPPVPGGGHRLDKEQMNNLVGFCDMVFYGKQLTAGQKAKFYSNPYFPTFREYYGGLEKMMPWINDVPYQ